MLLACYFMHAFALAGVLHGHKPVGQGWDQDFLATHGDRQASLSLGQRGWPGRTREELGGA